MLFQPAACEIAACNMTKHWQLTDHMSIVNDKTKPLPCPPTFSRYPPTPHKKGKLVCIGHFGVVSFENHLLHILFGLVNIKKRE